jgi:hypothetical protein
MPSRVRKVLPLLVFTGLLALFSCSARAAQSESSSTALSADLPRVTLPSRPPAIESINGETYATFEVNAETEKYLAKIPANKRAASDAYFEGGYWLQLWDFLIGVVLYLFLLGSGSSF